MSTHSVACVCAACRGSTRLFSTAETDEEVPPEVEALDGIADEDEAHNAERPSRSSLKKKTKKGTPLGEFKVGSTVMAKVKTITSYGAFLDFGADTDGLLHISNLSAGFVSDVKEFLKEGQEIEVRITNIDEKKNQVGLTMLSEKEEAEAAQPRQKRNNAGSGRRDDSKIVAGLASKGFDPTVFVEGEVVSTVDFGAFVRIDASKLNPEVEGDFDGLVHISALTVGRADSVASIVKVGEKVQVRCKAIDGKKVSLSMISVADEEAANERRAAMSPDFGGGGEGAKDWKESLEKMQTDMPSFANGPMVVDLRK